MSTLAAAQPLAADAVVAEASVPPLAQARMLNEYAYCPTLFSLEWWTPRGRPASTWPRAADGTGGWMRADSVTVINLGRARDPIPVPVPRPA
jgi:hypothetical protein